MAKTRAQIMVRLASEKRAFSGANACAMLTGMLTSDRKVVFSAQAVLALPHLVTDCEAALLKGNRDGNGHPQVLCSFSPGELVRPVPRGLEVASAIVLFSRRCPGARPRAGSRGGRGGRT